MEAKTSFQNPQTGSVCSDWKRAVLIVIVVTASLLSMFFCVYCTHALHKNASIVESLKRRIQELETRECLFPEPQSDHATSGDAIRRTERAIQPDQSNRLSKCLKKNRRIRNAAESRSSRLDDLTASYININNKLLALEIILTEQRAHSSVHLDVSNGYYHHVTSHPHTLRWQRVEGGIFSSRYYAFDDDYMSVTVNIPGMYFLNLQITFNGRLGQRGISSPCSFIVRKCQQNQTLTSSCAAVTYGAATQYSLGQVINFDEDGDAVYPYDTVTVSTLVTLQKFEKLYVKLLSPACVVLNHYEKSFMEIIYMGRILP